MDKFYDDIQNVSCEQLLKATPYSKEPMLNFDGNLDRETFFQYLYTAKNEDLRYCDENNAFDNKIDKALAVIKNTYSKVGLINIQGYGGCGKTTYIHNKLYQMKNNFGLGEYDVIDFEGAKSVEEPFIKRIVEHLMTVLLDVDISSYFDLIADEQLYYTFQYSEFLERLTDFASKICEIWQSNPDKRLQLNLTTWLRKEQDAFQDKESYIYFLLLIDFLLLLYGKFLRSENNQPIIIVLDNADSMSNQRDQEILLPVFVRFINECNYFFCDNNHNQIAFRDKEVKEVLNNTKLMFILTTRIATIKHFERIVPDLERVYVLESLPFPMHYYDHRHNIHQRFESYKYWEKGNKDSEKLMELYRIDQISEIAYQNDKFLSLFNGSVRITVERLCDLLEYPQSMINDLLDMSNQERTNEITAGVDGFFLWLILYQLKSAGVYKDKLNLNSVNKSSGVSLSRILLTVLREKGEHCSVLELLMLLTPLGFSATEICESLWQMCEACRDSWRRLILFDRVFPKSKEEMLEQALLFQEKNYDDRNYTMVSLCISGRTYIEYVVPHFEFMLSRIGHPYAYVHDPAYQPLFSSSSERNISQSPNKVHYEFETKIDKVFRAVKRCCISSSDFGDTVRVVNKISRHDYIYDTVFNYHAVDKDSSIGFKQSYESRLIFSHVGYIERYRRYLLKKHEKMGGNYLTGINKRLVDSIIRYLKLYFDSNICYQTEAQNRAAKELLELANIIAGHGYTDLETRIEVKE